MATEQPLAPPPGAERAHLADSDGLFVRNATGLVRELSQRDNFFLAALGGAPAAAVGITVFFALSGFPGGNLFLAGLLCVPLTVAFSFAFGLMTAAIPRSGGDYTVVSRVLSPQLGLISSACMIFGGFALSGAFLGKLFDTLAIAPSLQTIGVVAHSHTVFSWGTTLLGSKPWQFAIGCGMFAIGALAHMGGPHRAKYVLRWGFIISTAGLFFCALVALFTSRATFARHFNHLAAPLTGSSHTYQAVIATATKAGVDVHPGVSVAATVPIIGVFASFAIYTWFASFAGGELRQAGSLRTASRMALGGVFTIGLTLLALLPLFHSYGKPFLTAAFGGGFPAQLGTLPAYFTLTAFQLNSTIVAILLCLTFWCLFPMFAVQQLLGFTRVLFAWSFDGILPDRVAKVSPRTHAPTTAILLAVAIYIAALAWVVWDAAALVQVLVYTTVIGLVPMICVAIAAIALPWRRPELYRASGISRSVLGVPVCVMAGAAAALSGVFVIWMYFHYKYFGLADKGKFFLWVGGTMAVGLAYYLVVRWLKARRGVDLALVYSEIPPE